MSRDWHIIADDEGATHPPVPSEGLDERRVRAVALERRAADRSRIRAAVVAPTCAGLAIALATRAVVAWSTSPWFAAASAIAAVVAAVMAVRSIAFRRSRVARPEPLTPPDFTTLGGEGDAADRLRAMRDRDASTQPAKRTV